MEDAMTATWLHDLEGYSVYESPNWDGYGGDPITPETLAHAKIVGKAFDSLPVEIWPAPGGDGTIGFEIKWPGGEIWIDVGPGEKMNCYIPRRAR